MSKAMTKLSFRQLIAKVKPQGKDPNRVPPPARLLCIDPGHTTGWALFVDGYPNCAGHLTNTNNEPGKLNQLITTHQPDLILYEEFVLYPWASKSQSWSDLPTVQIIGVLKHLAHQADIPLASQGANVGKGFVTDQKLKEWGFYKPALRHAMDALRHGCHYLIFGPTARTANAKGGNQNSIKSKSTLKKPSKKQAHS